jgi:hypothetical protein
MSLWMFQKHVESVTYLRVKAKNLAIACI